MSTAIKIDIISDVMCPWCAVGYASLNKALEALADKVTVEIQWHPFELNPAMPAEGQDLREHLTEKYGSTDEQSRENRQRITDMGKGLGFEFNFYDGQRILNTFAAHQLLTWAGELAQQNDQPKMLQTALKMALFHAYFRDGRDVSQVTTLLDIAQETGLKREDAEQILTQQTYAGAVRAEQQQWQEMGIHSVPAVILQNKYLVSGGQPPEAFIQALTQIIKEDSSN